MSTKNELQKKYRSSTDYILKSLIPYSEPNIKLAYKPNQFFDDLEKLDGWQAKRKSLRTSYYRAIKKGLLEIDETGIPRLTEKGKNKIKVYKPKKLGKNARILVTFDIPEVEKRKRERLRVLLRELYFKQVQKSVWETEYDVIDYLKAEIEEKRLQPYVNVYESLKINL
ncbi:CRISPR-associated endonuclease Cas2 [Candidatus Parcubacteria bacterium]|nr:CRISPR-associated endonuclease Cas2 [Candidatus Parcubacteria bacterium]